MNAALDRWSESKSTRRGCTSTSEPLARPVLGQGRLEQGPITAAAHSIVEAVAETRVSVSFEAGRSYAALNAATVNLDGSILRAKADWSLRAERLFGVAGHEGAHLRWTPRGLPPQDPLFRYLHDILEDERIEILLAREKPCLAHPLAVARRDLIRPADPSDPFLAALFTLVRCEQEIDPRVWKKYREALEYAIRQLIPFPMTPKDVRKAALRLALVVPPEERDRVPKPPEFLGPVEGELDELVEGDGFPGLDVSSPPFVAGPGGQCSEWPPVIWTEAPGAPNEYCITRAALGAKPGTLADRLRALLPRTVSPRQGRGRLDRKRLHAYRYDHRLFKSSPRVPLTLSIATIVDLSGSMRGSSQRIAQQVAVLLNEAVARLPDVELKVFGHAADRPPSAEPEHGEGANTHIIRFPLDAGGRCHGLGSLPIGGNNRDAHAIRVIGEDLLSSSGSVPHRIAIIVADGAPQARGFDGAVAVAKTREAILWLEKIWGPVLFIATDSVPQLRRMVPGPSYRFRSERPVEDLAIHLTTLLRRTRGVAA